MSLSPSDTIVGISNIIVGFIALTGVVLTLRQNAKLNPVHKELTVNHHSSSEPTVKDRLDNIEKAQTFTLDALNKHIEEHKK